MVKPIPMKGGMQGLANIDTLIDLKFFEES